MWQTVERLLHLYGTFNLWIREWKANKPKSLNYGVKSPTFSGMSMGLGGNPYGPAGTGKTESVKALGGLFGRQVLVFNCDEVSTFLYKCCH